MVLRKSVSFRLRKIDEDLAKAIEGIDSDKLSEMCRDGLRLILGIRTTKRVEVTERALIVPEARAETPPANEKRTASQPSKPFVAVPQNKP